MENREPKYHRGRMAEALREELIALVEGELGDPRIGLVSVSEVHLSDDGRSARVFVAATGNEDEAQESLAGLDAARGYIRHQLTSRLALRQAPEIVSCSTSRNNTAAGLRSCWSEFRRERGRNHRGTETRRIEKEKRLLISRRNADHTGVSRVRAKG